MTEREYYSARMGKNPHPHQLDLDMFLRLFGNVYTGYASRGYFQEAFGYYCTDAGRVNGTLGSDVEAAVFGRLRKPSLWPIEQQLHQYSEDDAFDVIEFLYDVVSRPGNAYYHSWNQCGYHYSDFNAHAGQHEYREEINGLLRDYGDGYVLSKSGDIQALGPEDMRPLLEQELPEYDPGNVDSRVEAAIHKFRHHTPSVEDKREAVRQLADVLEFLRPKLKGILSSKDEDDLFNIANNFGIRHHNLKQKIEYDERIWLDWMFHYYLNTIHATVALLKREGVEFNSAG
jgi:hypothetical protein